MNFARRAGLAALLLVCLFAAWRVAGQLQADRLAAEEPQRALRWRPSQPRALLAQAEARLAAGDPAAARDGARRLLADEPLQGEAFRILAQVADREGKREQARRLFLIAERRAPRDLATRAWLARDAFGRGDLALGLSQLDRVLRMSPAQGRALLPLMVTLARDPAFARLLARELAGNPPWRAAMLAALQAPKTGDAVAEGQVMQALQAQGDLSAAEYDRWLEGMMSAGRWGEAYARWASRAVKPGGRLPAVYNGDFERPPSNAGFDWRLRRVPGVQIDFPRVEQGAAARLRFLGRRVPQGGLDHPLLLVPGEYALDMRVRGDALRTAVGLQWIVVCAGSTREVGR
ncbi:MAG TPA: hypothetical protein VL251_01755, partial [Thermomonas sp.]|nr:hypothetical protein [Thermomonas sp.]